jgi:hypothetical protein
MSWEPPTELGILHGLVRDDHVLEDAAAHATEWLFQHRNDPATMDFRELRIARDLCVLILRLKSIYGERVQNGR